MLFFGIVVNYLYHRAIEPIQFFLHQNSIIRYINCHDYRNGIAGRKEGPRSYYINPVGASSYISGLFGICDNATHAEKVAFLQHPNSQRKLFKIINGLFLYFHQGWCSDLPLTYLHKLLKLLALDPHVEETFYHSPTFIMICVEETLGELYNQSWGGGVEKNLLGVRNLIFAAVTKYPSLELKLFSNQNIQDLISNKVYYGCSQIGPMKQIAHILCLLSRTSIHSNGLLTNQAILKHIPTIKLNLDSSSILTATIFYASILVTFMDDPNQLSDYFLSCTSQLIERLNKIIDAEMKMRSDHIESNLFFEGSCSLNFDLSSEKRHEALVSSLAPDFAKERKWKSTFFSTSSNNDVTTQINNFKSYVFLGKYLSKETNKTDYIKLLNNGFSSDFVARIALHDMLSPQQRLTPQLLSHEPRMINYTAIGETTESKASPPGGILLK